MKTYYVKETEKTINSLKELKKEDSFVFALVADSHLSDNRDDTCENIKAVDEAVRFECLIHLGDLLCGNIPEKVSRKLLREELACYRNSVKSNELYVAQGNHDGYRDETYKGQTVVNMALDENWYEDTCFMDKNKNLHRPKNEPYFYIDYPDRKMRFVFLCTNSYEINKKEKIFKKIYGMSDEQIEWLGREALKTPEEYTIFVYSHIHPFILETKNLNVIKEYPKYVADDGPNFQNAVALFKAYKNSEKCIVNGKEYDFSNIKGTFGVWFFGHDHCDVLTNWKDLNFAGLASQTAYIPQLWEPLGEYPYPREIGTLNEDVWDGVVINTKERTIHFVRFGAGEDRVLKY